MCLTLWLLVALLGKPRCVLRAPSSLFRSPRNYSPSSSPARAQRAFKPFGGRVLSHSPFALICCHRNTIIRCTERQRERAAAHLQTAQINCSPASFNTLARGPLEMSPSLGLEAPPQEFEISTHDFWDFAIISVIFVYLINSRARIVLS